MDIKKYWTMVVDFVSYSEGYRELRDYPETTFLTRKEWGGIHYINRYGEYCILLKTGQIIINPVEVYKTDEPDWILVEATEEALRLIQEDIESE